MDLDNPNNYPNYSFTVGGLYKVAMGKAIAVGDFRLPASKNDFKAENFSCTLNKLEKEYLVDLADAAPCSLCSNKTATNVFI